MKKYIALFISLVLLLLSFSACKADGAATDIDLTGAELIFEETVSPNKEFVTDDADVVYYTVRVYQRSDMTVIVQPDSNSEFYKVSPYTVACSQKITKDDVSLEWQTLGGSTEYTEKDELALADVSILLGNSQSDERVVSFIGKAVNIISQAVS